MGECEEKKITKEERYQKFTQTRKDFDLLLSKKIFTLVDAFGYKNVDISQAMKKKYGIEIRSGTLSSYRKNSDEPKLSMPTFVVKEICDMVGVSMDKLISETMAELQAEQNNKNNDAEAPSLPQMLISVPASEGLIMSASNSVFNGYWGTYYTYFFPTISSENNILTGTLKLYKGIPNARAKLTLDTGKFNDDGSPFLKIYDGTLLYSSTAKCCYCVLSSDRVGEMSFFMFRYFRLHSHKLECRLCEALTASAGGEDTYPTVHRMLISREAIEPEHLQMLSPVLNLNNSQITISAEGLKHIANMSEEYVRIVNRLITSDTDPTPFYLLREDSVRTAANEVCRRDKSKVTPFVMAVRSQGLAFRYNKVSHKADDTVRDQLRQLGYYKSPRK